MADVGVDFTMFESLLQVLVDGFVRDFTEQCQIRYTDFFLLCDFESSFLDLRLIAAIFLSTSK